MKKDKEDIKIFVIPHCGCEGFEISETEIMTTTNHYCKTICPKCKKEVYID